MKKVMIGILILIPIIVLVVVALVSVIVSVNAHIAVEDLQLRYKGTDKTVYDLQIPLDEVANGNIYNYVDAIVYPQKATNKTVEWQIVGDVSYTDENYEALRNKYLSDLSALKAELEGELARGSFSTAARQNAYNIAKGKYYKDSSLIISAMADILLEKVYPAAAFVDGNGKEVESNTTGKMIVSSYCKFTIRAQAETVSKTITVSVVGYDVERVTLNVSEEESTTLGVGESMRIFESYTPIDSIVNKTIWSSSDESVVSVDRNGVVTALKEGRATITLKASVYSSEKEDALRFVEGSIELNVEQKGASSIFGEKLVTSKSSFSLAEIGVVKDEITSVEGATVNADGTVSMIADTAVITTQDGKKLTVTSCSDNDIAFRNIRFYENESGYVLAVGENVLDLDLVWADMLKEGNPQGVVWTSSDSKIATVDENGEVKGVSSGLVTITATLGAKSVSVTINVQNKLSQIQLRTSDASLAIGIARETVFASQKYVDVSVNNDKVANSTLIAVQGQPEGATAAQLAAFYSAYNFEIVEGKEFASLDTVVRNKVVFTNATEGMGKQKVVVKVSAKYPKYEGMTRFTTETVALNVVYGVAVKDIRELQQASKDQEAYAKKEDNIVNPDGIEVWRLQNGNDTYIVRNAKYSKQTYAIVFENNCAYTPEYDKNGEIVASVTYDNFVRFYGDVYGNNHMLSAKRGQVKDYLVGIHWSNVKMSNLVMRVNDIGDNTEITDAEDTQSFKGDVVDVEYGHDRLKGIRFEYCIFENSRQGVTTYNADIEYDGCIMRNMIQCAMYIPQRIYQDEYGYRPWYSHVSLNNFICSNTLGTLMSITYEAFTMTNSTTGRFVKNDLSANEKFFMDTFYKDGINCVVTQTGFLDAYNWQDIRNAKLIDLGEDQKAFNDVIGKMLGNLIEENSTFANYKFAAADGKTYMHVAFLVTGISFGDGITDAPTYLELDMEDKNYHCIDTHTLKEEGGTVAATAAKFLKGMSIKLYGYDNTSPINPNTPPYQVNSALIARIHS